MANSGTVTAGSAALASQYNNLRDDVLNVSTGHTHTGASENGAKVAATGVSSGTAAISTVLTADGSGGASFLALAAAGADVQEFTSSGSWVKPAGKSAVYVFAIGGGGGGASGDRTNDGSSAVGGYSGSGAAHAALWLTASSLPGTVTITIGAGGAGGTGASSGTVLFTGAAGASGGVTTFGTSVRAVGGPAGLSGAEYAASTVTYGVGLVEWGRSATMPDGTAAGTSDAGSTSPGIIYTQLTPLATQKGGVGLSTQTSAIRTFNRTASGGPGGISQSSGANPNGGGAGARGFGANGTIPIGGTGGSAVAATAGTAGSVCTVGYGHGGGGGGAAFNANSGAGGAGYLGGGGGGGGGVQVNSATGRTTGAGGAGGGGYILVISV